MHRDDELFGSDSDDDDGDRDREHPDIIVSQNEAESPLLFLINSDIFLD